MRAKLSHRNAYAGTIMDASLASQHLYLASILVYDMMKM
jgi:hypothetical protein